MDKTTTQRGFGKYEFEDANGNKCSVQESSACREEGLIWLGCSNSGIRVFVPYGKPESWQPKTDEEVAKAFGGEHCITNNRMHLTQSQVKELLPILRQFVKNGTL